MVCCKSPDERLFLICLWAQSMIEVQYVEAKVEAWLQRQKEAQERH